MSKFHFFYGGPFSQWHRSTIVIDGVSYNCAEQYMMAMKAKLFGDDEAYAKIMKSHDPSTQKATGRKVRGFDADRWNQVAREFVYRANLAKFSRPDLKPILLDTGDAELVEASPSDRIWGIGMSETDPDRFDKSKWRGTNWLGEAIMRVRDKLRSEEEPQMLLAHLPYEEGRKDLTVGDMRKLDIPDDYVITFDSFYGYGRRSELAVIHAKKAICINF